MLPDFHRKNCKRVAGELATLLKEKHIMATAGGSREEVSQWLPIFEIRILRLSYAAQDLTCKPFVPRIYLPQVR